MEKIKLLQDSLGQITILLFGLIGYFIKRVYDHKSKKIEFNHSIFQQNKITTINNFFKAHAMTELMWTHLKIYQVLQNKFDAKDLDDYIFPSLNQLRQVEIEMKLYLSLADQQTVSKIIENHFSVNRKVSELFFRDNNNESLIKLANSFEKVNQEVSKMNNILLDNLCNSLKSSFTLNKTR